MMNARHAPSGTQLSVLRRAVLLAGLIAAGTLATAGPVQADRIPAFARKYKVSCALCHAPFPRLNAFGEDFAANGFMFARGEGPVDTINTGDSRLRLQGDIPLAIRLDSYLTGLSKSGDVAATDLKTPWGIKLLTGGQVTDKVAYYMYFFLSERGEVAGLEDAYLQFNDVIPGLDVIAGQFQVSDPLMKRELRLEFEDYQPYRVRVGDVRADLTYERGFLAFFSPWKNGDVALIGVNGKGLGEATSDKSYDTDNSKNFGARLSQDLGFVRLGAFAYSGKEASGGLESNLFVWGPDATLPLGPKTTVNLQYLHRRDGNPFFLNTCAGGDFRCAAGAADPLESEVNSYMAELFWAPRGDLGRWYFTALYNLVDSDRTVFNLRVGEPTSGRGFIDHYETFSGGAHYFAARNLRFMGEITWDFALERARFTTGVITAF